MRQKREKCGKSEKNAMKSENHAVNTTRIENPGYQVSGS